jgi:hypothetical protein
MKLCTNKNMQSILPKIKINDTDPHRRTAEFCMKLFEISVPTFPVLGGKSRGAESIWKLQVFQMDPHRKAPEFCMNIFKMSLPTFPVLEKVDKSISQSDIYCHIIELVMRHLASTFYKI